MSQSKKNANINGLNFENKTCIINKLIDNNFIKNIINPNKKFGYYYELNIDDNNKIIYLTQHGFKLYFSQKFNINVYKLPDEAFLIFNNNQCYIKILEKKNQNVEGSVEEKIKLCGFNKREYEKMFNFLSQDSNIIFNISYAFCVNKFLENKLLSNQIKYNIIKEIIEEDNIKIFYGEDDNYFDNLYEWINKI